MADVAYLLHWPPDTMHPMELGELMQWRHLAVQRAIARAASTVSRSALGEKSEVLACPLR